jgi:NADPH-ferrihemoprotein reductase
MTLETIIAAVAAIIVVYLLFQRLQRSLLEKKNKNIQGGFTQDSPPPVVRRESSVGGLTVRLLFGTQTGTSEKLAKQLKNTITETYGTSCRVSVEDLETYRHSENLADEQYVFFFVATYGDGEPTDTCIDFDTWLSDSVNSGEAILEGVRYGVFALGNREYEHFCAFGKKVDRVMAELGASKIVDRVDGDDSKCIEDDYEVFSTRVMERLSTEEPFQSLAVNTTVDASVSMESVPAYDVVFDITQTTEAKVSTLTRVRSSGRTFGHTSYIACVSAIKELHTEDSDRSCLHVELDISMSGVSYEIGDHVALLPDNGPEIVEEAAKALGLPLESIFTLEVPSGNPFNLERPFPGPISVRSALEKFADLTNPPQKLALKYLSAFATDKSEAEELLFLASTEGKTKFSQMVHNNAMSLLELLQAFPSAKPSLGAFFGSICPRLQPRYYSISSSPTQNPGHIHITAAVIHEKKPTGKVHRGVCTSWLSNQELGAFAPIGVRKSHFKLPADPTVPIVMVGPGTGIAPFRGFLQERAKMAQSGVNLGPALLFFGCRNRKQDYIYQDELETYQNDGTLTGLYVAFSREREEKVYVQHKLLEKRDLVWSLLNGEKKGHFYICGEASRMAKDVHRALHEIIEKVEGVSGSKAEQYVKALSDQGRYQKDIW